MTVIGGLDPVFREFRRSEFWFCSVQLSGLRPVTESIAALIEAGVHLSREWGCRINIDVEPDGDATETQHFAHLDFERGAAWATLTVFPEHLGGDLTPAARQWLDEHHWIRSRPTIDSAPAHEDRWALDGTCPHCDAHIGLLRLTPDHFDDDYEAFAEAVVAGLRAVTGTVHERWYLIGEAQALAGGRLLEHQPRWMDADSYWTLRLGDLLPAAATNPAIWRHGTLYAELACSSGWHRFHAGPCLGDTGQDETDLDDPGLDHRDADEAGHGW